jgi:phenylpyruvate tautomerase PptA (4-oxalocrotonate tautomerase family)
MPYARISLSKGKSPEYVRALADNLHRAMVEALDVPEHDRFQVIHQHEPGELIFDRNYLSSGPRSDDFVLIAITAGRLRSTETKKAFYRHLVELLGKSPGIASSDVMVVVNTTEGDGWSFADGVTTLFDRPNK